MKQIYIGTYDIGYERIRLYLSSGTGAATSFLPDDKGLTEIAVGADHEKWRKVVGALLHEAQEMAMCRLGFAFYPHGSLNNGTANCVFMLNHEQFDECCMRASELLSASMYDLRKAWDKWHADKKKATKKPSAKKPKYVNYTLLCPKCKKDGKKVLIEKGKIFRENHYLCDHCGHQFLAQEPVKKPNRK